MNPQWHTPGEIREALEPLLARWAELLPPWLQDFRVEWVADLDKLMEVRVHHSNRWAVLRVGPGWLQESPEEREVTVVHEFVHVLLAPLRRAVDLVVDGVAPEDAAFHRLAQSAITDGEESAVEDAARAIIRARAA